MDIFVRVKRLNLPLGKYVVVGGAMEAHGIRMAKDIDIVAAPDLFQDLQGKGWKLAETRLGAVKFKLKGEGVDVFPDYSCGESYQADVVALIKNADVINGVPFVRLTELVKWKKAAGREKDLKDIGLIEHFLDKKELPLAC